MGMRTRPSGPTMAEWPDAAARRRRPGESAHGSYATAKGTARSALGATGNAQRRGPGSAAHRTRGLSRRRPHRLACLLQQGSGAPSTWMWSRKAKPCSRATSILSTARPTVLTATPDFAGTLDFHAYLFGQNAQPVGDHRLVFVQPASELKVMPPTESPVLQARRRSPHPLPRHQ